jgi:hypothetical protein
MSATQHAFRRYGLILGAVLLSLALLSVTASTAAATEQRAFFLAGEKSEEESKKPRFQGEVYPTSLNTTQASTYFEYGTQAGTLKCPGGYSGTLSGAASELLVSSFYYFASCTYPGGTGITITANGCSKTLTVSNEGPPYVGKVGYSCPTEKSYEFHTPNCTIIYPAQAPVAGVSYENTGEGKKRSVKVTFNVTGLKYTLKGPFPFGPCSGTHENGTFTGWMTLSGSA